MAKGLRLKFGKTEDGNLDVGIESEADNHFCGFFRCPHAKDQPDKYKCGLTGESVWDYWTDPGWCPEDRWYKDSVKDEFYKDHLKIYGDYKTKCKEDCNVERSENSDNQSEGGVVE